MTEQQFLSKVEELMGQVTELINDRAKKILRSGAVDLEDFDDNFKLPKMFIRAVASEIEWQFKSISEDRKERRFINNLKKFM